MTMNRMNLNMPMMAPNALLNNTNIHNNMNNNSNTGGNTGGTSPRRSNEGLTLAKKYRASSRQTSSSHRGNRRKYEEQMNQSMMVPKPILGAYDQQQHQQQQQHQHQQQQQQQQPTGLFPQINQGGGNHGQQQQMITMTGSGQKSTQKKYDPTMNMSNTMSHAPHGMTSGGAPSPHNNLKDSYSGVTTEEHQTAGVTSVRGLKPGNPNWINQDNFFIMENMDSKDTRIYCVLDGHGENGHLVSRRCRENFPHFILSNNLRMDSAFNMTHNDLCSSDIDVRCSGATCVLAFMQGNRLIVYNAGDSRAVLGRRSANGSITAIPMSNDHKPDKPEERKRILNCGGHLGCRQVLVNQGNRGPVSMPVGPCRVWYQHRGETLGLAMSRSLGDSIVHKFGVSCEPEAIEHILDDNDEFLIIATDGIWDVVDNNHAVQMVHNFSMRSSSWNPLEASGCVVKFARSRWEKLSPMIDDITCIVIKIQR
jgi:serine/threonine protein phosphatase PrpC